MNSSLGSCVGLMFLYCINPVPHQRWTWTSLAWWCSRTPGTAGTGPWSLAWRASRPPGSETRWWLRWADTPRPPETLGYCTVRYDMETRFRCLHSELLLVVDISVFFQHHGHLQYKALYFLRGSMGLRNDIPISSKITSVI